jgi:choice-of-anchor A domain-containing protein
VCSNIPEGARIIQRGKCDYIPAPVCDNPTNPFNSAADFSVFITSGDFKSSNNRVGGRIAANGNIELNNFLVGDDFETSDFQCVVGGGPFSLAAAGTVIFPGNGQVLAGSIASSDNGVNIGSAITGSLSDPTCSASVNIRTTGILFDPDSFKNLADDLKNIEESDKVRFGTNGKKDSDPNAWVFTGRTGSKDGSVDVFYVPKGEDLIKTGYWELNNVDEASTIIVNIGGSSAGFNNLDLSAWKNWSSRVIFNFYEAQSLTIQGVAVQGSILAPRAIVSASNGQVRGQIIAKQWFDGSSVYVQWNGGFSGCIPSSAL